jgi:hypothetical protein
MAEEKDFDKDAIAAEVKVQTEEADDEKDLLEKTEERLKVLDGDYVADESDDEEDSTPEDEDEKPAEDADEEDDPTPHDDKKDEEDDVAKDDTEDDKDEEAHKDEDQKDKPQISDAYYRAAIHNKYTDDDIVKLMKADPDLALRTFGQMHESMNRASQEFADIGRFKKQQAEKDAEDKQKDKPADKPAYKKVDTTSIRAEHGDVLADLIDGQQNQIVSMQDQMNEQSVITTDAASSHSKELSEEQDKHSAEQIESFFGSKDMAKYVSEYGAPEQGDTKWTTLMPAEMMNRVAVLERADELVVGAVALGREMPLAEALERAHLMVTEPIREKIIREDIMAKVVKRSKGISLKPSGRVANVEGDTGKKTTEKAIANASERLAKVFGK